MPLHGQGRNRPQRLKPGASQGLAARLKPCPSESRTSQGPFSLRPSSLSSSMRGGGLSSPVRGGGLSSPKRGRSLSDPMRGMPHCMCLSLQVAKQRLNASNPERDAALRSPAWMWNVLA